jgi:beta-lactamase regulating signal transducer with metallopeptidase domain
MLAWMIYATLVGVLLAGAGALLEEHSPWLAGRRRMVWLGVIVGSLLLAVAVTVMQGGPRTNAAPTSELASGGRETSPPAPGTIDISAGTLTNAPAPVETRTNLSADARTPSLDIVLIIAWLSCSALCMVVLIASAWRVSRMRRSWRESVIAGVPVLVSHDVGPAVIGLVHHGIVVPSWVEALRDDEQRTVMTHEREHVRAGDPLLLWGATVLVALAPWNAALWYALRRLRHAIEMDCDARVLRSRPDARAYCTLLLDVGERTLAGVAPMAALAEPATLLERRIEAMTAPTRARKARVVISGLAALLLVAVACWAPRPEVAPRARIVSLVAELNSLLTKDSSQHFLTATERANAVRAVSSSGTVVVPAALDSVPEWKEALRPRLGDAVKKVFPQLYTRTDTSHVLVTLTYDYTGKLKGHTLRPMPNWREYRAPDFSSVQIKRFGMEELPDIHATLVYVLEKWDISAEPSVTAYGGLHGPAESKNVPPTRQYGHRVDSLARVDFPEAFTARDDAIVVTVLFGANGEIVRSFAKHFTVDEVFDVVPGTADRPLAMRSSTYLLSRTIGTPFPKLTSFGSQTMKDAPQTIFVFGELAADAQMQRELSRDSLLKLASRYESTTVHGISSGTSFVALRFDRNGAVIAHANIGYGPNSVRPSITSMRQSLFGIESTQENDDARVVLLRAGEPDAMPGPLYVLVVRPRG